VINYLIDQLEINNIDPTRLTIEILEDINIPENILMETIKKLKQK
jgi:hypothetical protein